VSSLKGWRKTDHHIIQLGDEGQKGGGGGHNFLREGVEQGDKEGTRRRPSLKNPWEGTSERGQKREGVHRERHRATDRAEREHRA